MARATRSTTKRPASPAPDSAPAAKQPRKTRGAKAKADPVDEDSPEPEDKKKSAPKKGKANSKVKTEASEDELDGDDAVPAKTAPKKAKGNAKVKTEQAEDGEDSAVEEKKAAPATEFKEAQVAKAGITIPLDEGAPTYFHVFIDPADQLIYDASLNQTNASGNNNKFYRIQLLEDGNTYKTWTRWGRVGEHGQSAILGNGSLDDALKNFEKKFKDKSGLKWADRGEKPKPQKYVFIEKSYVSDDSEGEGEEEETKAGASREREDYVPPECTLAPPVRSLMELIFNQQYFEANMASLNYDSAKLPLGKLSKATITGGYEVLKELSDLLDDPSLASNYNLSAMEATESLSNLYYSTIPHAFGRNRPPVIRTDDQLKKEIELLTSLTDLKDADLIMKKEKKTEDIHQLDSRFKSLGMQEMTPLESKSAEFAGLSDYLLKTCGATHNVNYKVMDIFRIQRDGEEERFKKIDLCKNGSDRRLLWHGSRATNYGGILGQGLRIAPAEAPSTGFMFDRGIYLADMSSKSANYCVPSISGGQALLLLCEAELGNPMQELTDAKYDAGTTAAQQGMIATWGKGMTAPSGLKDAGVVHPSLSGVQMPDTTQKPGNTNVSGAYLQYNEFICYNVSQIKLRYLLRIQMR